MPSNDPSLISGLDPGALFGLADDSSVNAPGDWQPPSIEEAAKLFPNWKVLGLLGRGGMGAVYHVHQPDLDREVAVKLLPLEASRNEHQVERFRREARTLAKLKHPGIVALHEAGMTPAGHFFFVMEYIDGHPLSDLIAQSKMDMPRAIDIVRQVCDALAYAHGQGVVHRDIKPSNILIDALGHARVADFGLARWEKPDASGALELSRTGMFMGTPAYTAPEQARDAAHADHRADLYSLGVLLYEMLTGEVPRGVFQPPSRKSGSDARLDGVVQRALQERPEDRYQAASELKSDVTSVQTKPVAHARSKSAWPWTITTVVGLALLVLVAWQALERNFVNNRQLLSELAKREASYSPPPLRSSKDANPQQDRATPSPTPKSERVRSGLDDNQPPVPQSAPEPVKVAKGSPATPVEPPSMRQGPSKPTEKPVVATTPASQPNAKVWSINPLSPSLSPPDEVMKQGWKDCVLLKDGGAVLLDDGQTVYTWQGSSNFVHRIKDPAGFVSLSCNDKSVALLDHSGRLSVMRIGGTESPAVIRSKVVSATSSTGSTIAVITDDAAWLSTLRLSDPFRPLPYQSGMKLAVTANGVVFGLNDEGELVWHVPESPKFIRQSQHTNLRNLAVWGKGVLLITSDERVDGFELKEAVPSLGGITEIITGEGFAIARDWKNQFTLWGKAVPDSPQRMKMPEGTTHLTASPLGLIAAW